MPEGMWWDPMRDDHDPLDVESGTHAHRMVERSLSAGELESGYVQLTQRQAERLGLPEHQEELEVRLGGEVSVVVWNPVAGRLHGEGLADWLAFEASESSMLRIHHASGNYEAELVASNRSVIDGPIGTPRRAERTAELVEPRRRVPRRNDRFRVRRKREFTWEGNVGISDASIRGLEKSLNSNGWDTREDFELRERGERLATVSGFDELISINSVDLDPMPHQVATVRRVLADMSGRAILADEVGLGKTIEAGLIMSELRLRGMVRRILVICPASLREQWQSELREKFGIEASVAAKGTDSFAEGNVITSPNLARNHVDRVAAQDWDLVVVDEAHRFNGTGARKTRSMFRQLNSRYLLYLTATPVQNGLDELYEMVEALRPGTFGTKREFRNRYISVTDKRTPVDPEGLRDVVRQVMVRTTRAQAGVDTVQRRRSDAAVVLSDDEYREYHELLAVLRAEFRDAGNAFRRQKWAQRLISSPRALAASLLKAAAGDLPADTAQILDAIASSKISTDLTTRQRRFIEQVTQWVRDPDKGKVLVFTGETAVAEDLVRLVEAEGIEAVIYHGGMSSKSRTKAIRDFKSNAAVMVATDAGAEGLNLQFCNCVINYDLPWNPMRIEQRIGRVHRLTQRRDVHVANMFALRTVEERVYELLRDKLRMFELLFGQITLILGEIGEDEEGTVEQRISKAVFETSAADLDQRFDTIGRSLGVARDQAQSSIDSADDLRFLATWDDSHRDGLTIEGSDDLRPEEATTIDRRAEVAAFVCDLLELLGAELDIERHDDGSGDNEIETFLTARLPGEVRTHFGDVDSLHVAFDPRAMSRHRAAELCVVGSDLFEEFIEVVRPFGDLLIELPDLDVDALPPVYTASDGWVFGGRSLVGPVDWDVTSRWRVHFDAAEPYDDIVASPGVIEVPRDRRRVLHEADGIPETLDISAVVARVVKQGQQSINERLQQDDARGRERQVAIAAEQIERCDEQIAELTSARNDDETTERIAQLRALKRNLRKQTSRESQARSDLIGVNIVGRRVVMVNEHWLAPDGSAHTIGFLHDCLESSSTGVAGADGAIVATIGLCARNHLVDSSGLVVCERCTEAACGACSPKFQHQQCQLCARSICSSCRASSLCHDCVSPTLLDGGVATAARYRIGADRILTVGPRSALLDGTPLKSLHLVPPSMDVLVDRLGCDPDSGFVSDPWPASVMTNDGLSSDRSDHRWELVVDGHHLDMDTDAFANSTSMSALLNAAAPVPEPAHVELDAPASVQRLVAELRAQHRWEIPGVVDRKVGVRERVAVVDGSIAIEAQTRHVDGAVTSATRPMTWQPVLDAAGRLAGARSVDLDVVTLVRPLNHSFLIEVTERVGKKVWFVPDEGRTYDDEVALSRFGLGTLGVVGPLFITGTFDVPPPVPDSEASLSDRQSQTSLVVVDGSGDRPLSVADLSLLGAAEHRPAADLLEDSGATPPALPLGESLRALLSSLGLAPIVVEPHFDVTEEWSGRGSYQFHYQLGSSASAPSPAGDARSFTIDDHGHPVSLDEMEECDVCSMTACERCDEPSRLRDCGRCERRSCGNCQSGSIHSVETFGPCVRCGIDLCTHCGRAGRSSSCAVCDARLCHACSPLGTCAECESFSRALPSEIDEALASGAVPSWLNVGGHSVHWSRTDRRVVAVIAGGARRELVVVDDGVVTRWVSSAPSVLPIVHYLSAAGPVAAPVEHRWPSPDLRSPEIQLSSSVVAALRVTLDGDVVAERLGGDIPATVEAQLEAAIDGAELGDLSTNLMLPTSDPGAGPVIDTVLADAAIPTGKLLIVETQLGSESLDASGGELCWAHDYFDARRVEPVRWASDRAATGAGTDWVATRDDLDGSLPTWNLHVCSRHGWPQLTIDRDGVARTIVLTESESDSHRFGEVADIASRLGIAAPVPLVVDDLGAAERPVVPDGVKLEKWTTATSVAFDLANSGNSPTAPPLSVDEVEMVQSALPGETREAAVETATVSVDLSYSLRSLIASETIALLTTKHLHDCEWKSDLGEKRMTLESAGSAVPVMPPLDDGSSASVFTIDPFGHAVSLSSIVSCPVCGGSTCLACSPATGVLACQTCGGDACGSCRSIRGSRPRAEANSERCGPCGRSLCVDCGWFERAAACTSCDRPTCPTCLNDGICLTCGSLTLAPNEIADGVPDWLAWDALTVFASCDETHWVLVALGGVRSECVLVDRDTVEFEGWVSFGELTEADWGIAANVRGRLVTSLSRRASEPAPLDPTDAQVLRVSVFALAELWSDDGTVSITAFGTDAESANGELMKHFESLRRPAKARGERAGALAQLAERLRLEHEGRVRAETGISLVISRGTVVTRESVTSEGVLTELSKDGVVEASLERFSPASTLVAGIEFENAVAACWKGGTVTIAQVGPLAFVAVDESGITSWWRADSGPFDVQSVGLGWSLLGTATPVRVVTCSAPGTLSYLEIRNARLVERTLQIEVLALEPNGERTVRAAVPWSGSETATSDFVTAMSGDLPATLLAAERSEWATKLVTQRPPDPVDVELAWKVEDRWEVHGQLQPIVYRIAPGSLAPNLPNAGTALLFDRSLHLVSSAQLCPYCAAESCDQCETKVRPCIACGTHRCDECGVLTGDLALCPACANAVQEPGRRLNPFDRSSRYRGTDAIHSVRMTFQSDGTTVLEIADTSGASASVQVEADAAAALRRHLDRQTNP